MGLYDIIKPLIDNIVSQSKLLLENIEEGNFEQDLYEKAKDIASSCLSIASHTSSFIDNISEESLNKIQFQITFVKEYEENLRRSIIEMVNCSKLFFSSRLSFTNNNNLSNSLKQVLNNSKKLIEASKSIYIYLYHIV